MDEAGALVRRTRTESGLSVRELAARAQIASSTITRIESGRMDPTWGMMAGIFDAMGRELIVAVRTSTFPELAELTDAWHTDVAGQDRPDWTRVRAFIDVLRRKPEWVGPATDRAPTPSGSTFFDAFLAALADTLCDAAAIKRPSWTRHAPTLDVAWIGPGTPRMRKRTLAVTPPHFRERNIYLNPESLFRIDDAAGV